MEVSLIFTKVKPRRSSSGSSYVPDIAMCEGVEDANGIRVECPKRQGCYRFTATPTPMRQSYFMHLPILPSGECCSYWPVKAKLATRKRAK